MSEPTSIGSDSVEQWRPVVGHEDAYSVSNHGRVRRDVPGQGTWTGRVIGSHISPSGYARVVFGTGEGRGRFVMVHRVVAAAFIGPCPEGCEINHRNAVKTDNRPENLEYISHGDNIRHAFALGLTPRPKGSKNHASKLTETDVLHIRQKLTEGVSLGKIGKQFGISKQVVHSIRKRETWRHV